jgi:hypothetical protein
LQGFPEFERIVDAVSTVAHTPRCFLCNPEPEWTWHESKNFRAVLGLGPIGPGYTLIAAREHLPSMLDLDAELAAELREFTTEVRNEMEGHWGPTVVGEHGRVAPCLALAVRRHEPHCLHAHRLVFPGHAELDLRLSMPGITVLDYESPSEAEGCSWPGQYLYVEDACGRCQVGLVQGPLPRQFLRSVVARARGQAELADWRRSPRPHELDAARLLLRSPLAA